MKSKIHVKVLSNGQPKRQSYVMKTWEELELIFVM